MTIPFLDLFKKLTGRSTARAAAASPVAAVIRPKRPDSERLSKTVLPNAARSFSNPDPFRSAAVTAAVPRANVPLEISATKITTSATRSRSTQLPPALARALEPKLERTISFKVADLIDAVPAGFIKPVEILDLNAVVSLKASEIEKGMPDKQPMISLPSLYQQAPEIFLRTVRPDDDTRVALPYEKVLEQFQSAQVRSDQIRDPAVPQLKTPILTATLRDSERFGTKIEPIETSLLPAVPVKQASAESIAEAEPDATPVQSQTPTETPASGRRVISLHSPELEPKSKAPEPPLSGTEFKIPFELSPNGTGAFAPERVPASSGPPVPTPLPFTPELSKISLKLAVDEPTVPTSPAKDVVGETAPSPAKTTGQENWNTATENEIEGGRDRVASCFGETGNGNIGSAEIATERNFYADGENDNSSRPCKAVARKANRPSPHTHATLGSATENGGVNDFAFTQSGFAKSTGFPIERRRGRRFRRSANRISSGFN